LESIFPKYKGKLISGLFKNFKSSPHTLHTKFSILPYLNTRIQQMKKLFKLASLLTLGLFFVACGDSASEGFTKSGKAGSLAVTYSSAKPLVVGDNTINVRKSFKRC